MFDKWQPIETAPRDGRTFLAVNKKHPYGTCRVVYFDEEAKDTHIWHVEDAAEGFNHHKDFFTHWMHQPEPPIEDLSETEALKIATHRHYKGGLYQFIDLCNHSETGEQMVLYKHLWPHEQQYWVRPYKMFYENLADGRARFDEIYRIGEFVVDYSPLSEEEIKAIDNESEEFFKRSIS